MEKLLVRVFVGKVSNMCEGITVYWQRYEYVNRLDEDMSTKGSRNYSIQRSWNEDFSTGKMY